MLVRERKIILLSNCCICKYQALDQAEDPRKDGQIKIKQIYKNKEKNPWSQINERTMYKTDLKLYKTKIEGEKEPQSHRKFELEKTLEGYLVQTLLKQGSFLTEPSYPSAYIKCFQKVPRVEIPQLLLVDYSNTWKFFLMSNLI